MDNDMWLRQRVEELAKQERTRRRWHHPAVVAALALFALPILGIGAYVIRNFALDFSHRDICPDYYSYQHAYVVDSTGRGLDSVAVTMWDNATFNVLYRTFTDSTGRFTLFNDFFSFAVHESPMTYETHVVYHGRADTILYKFERYNVCHFRRTEGPDSIVLDPGRIYPHVLPLRNARPVDARLLFPLEFDEAIELFPAPTTDAPPPGDPGTTVYGRFALGGAAYPLALTHGPLPCGPDLIGTGRPDSSTHYRLYVDWDGDGELADEAPRAWRLHGQGGDGSPVWIVTGSLIAQGRSRRCLFAARGLRCTEPVVALMRADAVRGKVTIGTSTYTTVLWDRSFTDYRDMTKVRLGIDTDQDGAIRAAAGSTEYCPSIRGTVALDTFRLRIDTIAVDGRTVYCSSLGKGAWLDDAAVGSVAPGLPVTAGRRVALDGLYARAPLTLLLFFEGDPRRVLDGPAVTGLVKAMRRGVGDVTLVGVQRGGPDHASADHLVVRENRGWSGPLVQRYRNTMKTEVVCVDRTGVIVGRGAVGTALIRDTGKRLGLPDARQAVALYREAIEGPRVIGTADRREP